MVIVNSEELADNGVPAPTMSPLITGGASELSNARTAAALRAVVNWVRERTQ
ncbi:uncharacterized protein METZ01_LOCUS401853 [marine metagenome]|uniref:Uncharacterized protein n=1 Tax=marine metagenome TaxID=408172 RepID=A0A382VR23_9ZZZZ